MLSATLIRNYDIIAHELPAYSRLADDAVTLDVGDIVTDRSGAEWRIESENDDNRFTLRAVGSVDGDPMYWHRDTLTGLIREGFYDIG